jgi:hypothetical protein
MEICPLVLPQPQRKSLPSAQEWPVLQERGVIDCAGLRQRLGLNGKTAARTRAKRTNMS